MASHLLSTTASENEITLTALLRDSEMQCEEIVSENTSLEQRNYNLQKTVDNLQNTLSRIKLKINEEVENVLYKDKTKKRIVQQMKSEESNKGKATDALNDPLRDLEKLEHEIETLNNQTSTSVTCQTEIITSLKQGIQNSNLKIKRFLDEVRALNYYLVSAEEEVHTEIEQNKKLTHENNQLTLKLNEITQKVTNMAEENDDNVKLGETSSQNEILDSKSIPAKNTDIVVQLISLVNENQLLHAKHTKYQNEIMELKFILQATEHTPKLKDTGTNPNRQPKSTGNLSNNGKLIGDKEEVVKRK